MVMWGESTRRETGEPRKVSGERGEKRGVQRVSGGPEGSARRGWGVEGSKSRVIAADYKTTYEHITFLSHDNTLRSFQGRIRKLLSFSAMKLFISSPATYGEKKQFVSNI